MLQNVRLWFEKTGIMRFISHLDLCKCLTRAINRSGITIWHTEGFNPHPFLTFANPLGLGIIGIRESFDIKLTRETELKNLPTAINKFLPNNIRVITATNLVMKASDIESALYEIRIFSKNIHKKIEEFEKILSKKEIFAEKKSKGNIKVINIKDYILSYELQSFKTLAKLKIVLKTGSKINVNPFLLTNELVKFTKNKLYFEIIRHKAYSDFENKIIWK